MMSVDDTDNNNNRKKKKKKKNMKKKDHTITREKLFERDDYGRAQVQFELEDKALWLTWYNFLSDKYEDIAAEKVRDFMRKEIINKLLEVIDVMKRTKPNIDFEFQQWLINNVPDKVLLGEINDIIRRRIKKGK
jgi:hypothetical protein